MTPQELKDARKQLGASQSKLATMLKMSPDHGGRTIRRWESGESPIPGAVEVAVGFLLDRKNT